MEKFVNTEHINELFETLEEGKIEYTLLRNIDNELPDKLSVNKDIDIIVHPKDIKKLVSTLKKKQWNLVKHPWDFGHNFVFLYSMDPFLFFKKKQLHLDVCFQLSCRSLNNGEWFPLDESIQDSIWIYKKKVDKPWNYVLSNEDYLIHLLTRSIFDKKEFTTGYIVEIEK
ncbi:nucleotidyltransferase family protein, partial [Flavobacteriaceae bacterium]|nr:nucleotidyltransferase family protein [Flavobacteriaceae bacterium]